MWLTRLKIYAKKSWNHKRPNIYWLPQGLNGNNMYKFILPQDKLMWYLTWIKYLFVILHFKTPPSYTNFHIFFFVLAFLNSYLGQEHV